MNLGVTHVRTITTVRGKQHAPCDDTALKAEGAWARGWIAAAATGGDASG